MSRVEDFLVDVMADQVAATVLRREPRPLYPLWPGTLAAVNDVESYRTEFQAARYVFRLAADHGADLSLVNDSDLRMENDDLNAGAYGTGFPALVRAFGILESAGVLRALESADLSQQRGEE